MGSLLQKKVAPRFALSLLSAIILLSGFALGTTAQRISAATPAVPILDVNIASEGLAGQKADKVTWTADQICDETSDECYVEGQNVPHQIAFQSLIPNSTYSFSVYIDHFCNQNNSSLIGYTDLNTVLVNDGEISDFTVSDEVIQGKTLRYDFTFMTLVTNPTLQFSTALDSMSSDCPATVNGLQNNLKVQVLTQDTDLDIGKIRRTDSHPTPVPTPISTPTPVVTPIPTVPPTPVPTPNCSIVSFAPVSLPNGSQGISYLQTFSGSGNPANYSYSLSQNTLPPGLTLSPQGVLSGVPTATGNFAFAVRAMDLQGCSFTRAYNLLILSSSTPITISPSTLEGGMVGTPYAKNFSATGTDAPVSFRITSGTLPGGLLLNTNGSLSGIPNTAGLYFFTVQGYTSFGLTGSKTYTLNISCPTVTFSPATLPNAIKNISYSQTITSSLGTQGIFSLLLGQLPPGFSMGNNGTLSGVTSQKGTYNFTVKVRNGSCQGTKAYSLSIQ